mgnify:FL=1
MIYLLFAGVVALLCYVAFVGHNETEKKLDAAHKQMDKLREQRELEKLYNSIKCSAIAQAPEVVKDTVKIVQPDEIYVFDNVGNQIYSYVTTKPETIFADMCEDILSRQMILPEDTRLYLVSYYRPPAADLKALSNWFVIICYYCESEEYYSSEWQESDNHIITISKEELNETL